VVLANSGRRRRGRSSLGGDIQRYAESWTEGVLCDSPLKWVRRSEIPAMIPSTHGKKPPFVPSKDTNSGFGDGEDFQALTGRRGNCKPYFTNNGGNTFTARAQGLCVSIAALVSLFADRFSMSARALGCDFVSD